MPSVEVIYVPSKDEVPKRQIYILLSNDSERMIDYLLRNITIFERKMGLNVGAVSIRGEDVRHSLSEFCDHYRPDLVVMHKKKRGRFSLYLLGGISETFVIRAILAPVLIFK